MLRALFLGSFAVLGSTVPFLAGELKGRGVDGTTFVFVMAALPLGRVVVGPWAGQLADTRGWARAGLRLGSALALVGAVGMLIDAGVGALVAAVVLFSVGYAPLGALVDSLALALLADRPDGYGALRGWGSAGYLLASFGVGWWVDLSGGSPFWITSIALASMGGAALLLPRPPAPPPRLARAEGVLAGLDAMMVAVLVAGALHFSVHVACSALLDLHLRSLGHPSRWTGIAIAAGVVVEIGVMSQAPRVLGRLGARRAFVGAMGLAAFRWMAMAVVEHPVAIVAVQALHGLTFGLFWVSAVSLVDAWAGPGRRARGQAALTGAVAGIGALAGVAGGAALVEVADTWTLFRIGAGVAIVAGAIAAWGVRR